MNVMSVLNCTKNIVKRNMKYIGPLAVAALYNDSTITKIVDDIRYSGNVGYDDAIKAIMESKMYSSDKCDAVSVVKVGEKSEYYKAIIRVVRSKGYSSDKITMIKIMNKNIEGEAQA